MADQKPTKSKGYCDLHENAILLYGPPKIGKTTLASQFPDAVFLSTERGTKHVQVEEYQIKSWAGLRLAVDALERNVGEWGYKTVVIDTVDEFYSMCEDFICQQKGIETLGDLDYGKGYAANTRELKKQMGRIVKLGLGLVMITHSQEKTVKVDLLENPYAAAAANQKGEVEMTVPTIPGKSLAYFLALADIILYCEIGKDMERVIYTQPARGFEAGDRSGRLPNTIELSYEALVSAYYGGVDTIKERIAIAEKYCSDHGIDFPAMPDSNRVSDYERHLQQLRLIAKSAQKSSPSPDYEKDDADKDEHLRRAALTEQAAVLLDQCYPVAKAREAACRKHLGCASLTGASVGKLEEFISHMEGKLDGNNVA